MNSLDFQILCNGLDRSIMILADILYYRQKDLSADSIKTITENMINLIDEREHFIKKRIEKVNK